jgi:hypothetical protein
MLWLVQDLQTTEADIGNDSVDFDPDFDIRSKTVPTNATQGGNRDALETGLSDSRDDLPGRGSLPQHCRFM